MEEMEDRELARRAVAWLNSVEPEITLDWDSFEYPDDIISFLWADYLETVAQDIERYAKERVAEVAAKIRADFRLEESEVTDTGVPIGDGQ